MGTEISEEDIINITYLADQVWLLCVINLRDKVKLTSLTDADVFAKRPHYQNT